MKSFFIAVLHLVIFAPILLAQDHGRLSYQGCLTDSGGNPVADGTYSVMFNLYDQAVGDPVKWTETQPVSTKSCVFDAVLGAIQPLDFAFEDPLWLGIRVNGAAELSPRTRLAAAPFALGLKGFRVDYATEGQFESANVWGGAENNQVASGVTGATISGGGGYVSSNPVLNYVSGEFGTIGGGARNDVWAAYGTISGGYGNQVQSQAINGVIGGGAGNAVGSQSGTIAGGISNIVQGQGATIGGGSENRAMGIGATVPGGTNNWARGTNSFAAGSWAHAQEGDHGTFVWADNTDEEFASTEPNQFLIRAGGGVGIGKTSPRSAVHVKQKLDAMGGGLTLERFVNFDWWELVADSDGLNFAHNGEYRTWLMPSGEWHVVSDRRLKTDVSELDGVLERVLRLRPSSYRFTDQPAGSRTSIGFIAQEVEELFPELVADKDGLKGLSYAGFAVLAIKAIQEQQAEIEGLKARIEELER